VLLGLRLVAGAPVEPAVPEVAVGDEGAHPQLLGQEERLLVVAVGACASGGLAFAAISARRRRVQASFPLSLVLRASSRARLPSRIAISVTTESQRPD
jgi:hypothetical protein